MTALASAAKRPENVVGMHFFNPPPLMRLLELIRADQTGDRAVEIARAVGAAMGKDVILATDGPGFLVNRCGRPFYTEALRCLQERIATHDAIDRIYRLGGGYRMGPFELMDLVGIDTGFEVTQSFAALSFGEPRWRPNPIQARMVAAGRLGRKSGRGYYDYARDPYRPDDPPAPAGGEDFRQVAADAGLVDFQLVNEAAFAIGEGVGSAADVDTGLTLGLNHPRGPVEWSRQLGLEQVHDTLDGLWSHYREERYRPAPLVTRAAARGVGLDGAAG